jgi:hypothetical protein
MRTSRRVLLAALAVATALLVYRGWQSTTARASRRPSSPLDVDESDLSPGTLSVFFRVIGDRKVGGVVDEARMTDETTIADPEFQTCVRESMMSVSFDAPPGDGEITVVYPILFSPEEPEAGAD